MLTFKGAGLSMKYLLTHTCFVVGRDLVSKVTSAHIASIVVGTILITSTNTQSTFIYVCVVGSCAYDNTLVLKPLKFSVLLCHALSYSHNCKFCCWKRLGIQGNNYTHNVH